MPSIYIQNNPYSFLHNKALAIPMLKNCLWALEWFNLPSVSCGLRLLGEVPPSTAHTHATTKRTDASLLWCLTELQRSLGLSCQWATLITRPHAKQKRPLVTNQSPTTALSCI